MARLAALENLLYYPTSATELKDWLDHTIEFSGMNYSILDPCVGEGYALRVLHDKIKKNAYMNVLTTGIEIDNRRAEQAAELLDQVHHGSFENFRLIEGKPDVTFFNPPYDEVDGKRVEIEWIEMIGPIIPHGGIVIMVLPENVVLGRNSAKFRLALRKHQLRSVTRKGFSWYSSEGDKEKYLGAARFRPEEFAKFKQYILVVEKDTYRTEMISEIHVDGEIGSLPSNYCFTFSPLPTGSMKREKELQFVPMAVELPDTVLQEEKLDDIFGKPVTSTSITPLQPLRPEHQAAVIAGGMFTGVRVENTIIRGGITVEYETVKTGSEEEGQITEEQIPKMIANLHILELGTGELQSVSSKEEEFGEIIEKVAQKLSATLLSEKNSIFTPQDMHLTERFKDVKAPKVIDGKQNGLFDIQKLSAAAILKAWEINDHMPFMIGEMGTGKSVTSVAAAVGECIHRKPHNQNIIILMPPKTDLVQKWKEEIGVSCRNIEHKVFELKSLSDVDEAFAYHDGISFMLVRETMLKASSGTEHTHLFRNKLGHRYCVKCGKKATLVSSTGEPIENENESRHCSECGEKYMTFVRGKASKAHPTGVAKYHMAKYLQDRYRGKYVAILDEAHQYKGGETARGYASHWLTSGARRALLMTGTIYNGMASSLFYNLYRNEKTFRDQHAYGAVTEFTRMYGLEAKITRQKIKDTRRTWSGYNTNTTERTKEIPGIHPQMIAMMLPYTIFMKLDDLDLDLPPKTENLLFFDAPEAVISKTNQYLESIKATAISEMNDGHMGLMSSFNWTRKGIYTVYPLGDEVDGESSHFEFQPMLTDQIAPKEEAVLRIISGEKKRGFCTLLYYEQMERRPIHDRLIQQAAKFGMKIVPMFAKVKSRKEFINNAIDDGADAILCNANLVREGIDLYEEFKTIVWVSVTDDAILVKQANARIDRIGQTVPPTMYYLGYYETYENERWVNTARKIAAMSAMHGDVRNGLAALLGDESLISTIQDMTVEYERTEGDLNLDDLPEIYNFSDKVEGKTEPDGIIETPVMSWYEWKAMQMEEQVPKCKPKPAKQPKPEQIELGQEVLVQAQLF